MSEWRSTTWGEICALTYGKSIKGYQDHDTGYPVYGTNGPIGYWDVPLQDEPGLIIGRKGAYRGVHYAKCPFFVIDTAYALKADASVDIRWAYYSLLNVDINSMDSGSAIPSTSRDEFYGIPVLLPPLAEQREIASILGALDDKIELNRRRAATLEEMARALYRSWFVDFDPVKAKAEGLAPAFMDEATAALFPDRFGDDGLPEGWGMRRLGDLLTLNYGKALKKEVRQAGQYPVYGSGGSDSSHVEALVSYPTIIVGRKGTVGSIYWSPRGCWPIDTTYYVSGSYPMVYALHVLRGLPLSEMNTDAAVPGLNRENAYRLEIPFPGEELVASFSNRAAAIQEKIDSIDQEISTLGALRDTLLPKLMSGELRVGEAQDQIEEVA